MDKKLKFTKFIAGLSVPVSHALGYNGSSLPGLISNTLYPDMLSQLSRDVTTVFITGTNGKSTAASFVYHLLDSEDSFINDTGSNMETGITTSFLNNTDSKGNPISHTAIMECDEYNLPLVARYIKHPIVAVLNVYQEQEERYGSIEDVMATILKGIRDSEASMVCINLDQVSLYEYLKSKLGDIPVMTFSSEERNADVCVIREGAFVRIITESGEDSFRFDVPGDFNVSNLAASVCVLKSLGMCTRERLHRIEELHPVSWHCQTIRLGSHKADIHLVKNTESLNRCLDLVEGRNERLCLFFDKSIVDGESSEWITFADLGSRKQILEQSVCAGDYADCVQQILQDTGISSSKTMTDNELFRYIRDSSVDLAVLANVRAIKKLKNEFEDSRQ